MNGGLVGAGQEFRRQAEATLANYGQIHDRRKEAGRQLAQADQESKLGLIGSGAGLGASLGGPWGALIGAGAGLLASELF